MDTATCQGLYPLHRCKTIHWVRHAEGFHNVAKSHGPYMSPELFDASLTPLGWQQADTLRKQIHESGLYKGVELVVVSPLLRTMQTAVGVFGGESHSNDIESLPLMVENAFSSKHSSVSSLNAPPFIAIELCHERLGVPLCHKRRRVSEYKPIFPAIDFSLMKSDDDILWKDGIREENEDIAIRGIEFLNWLWTRQEKEIAVVTHCGFLDHTFNKFGNDCHPTVQNEIRRPFNKCELRSMTIVDRSMISTHSSSTDASSESAEK